MVTSIFGVDVNAAKPTPDNAVTTLRKGIVGETMVAAIVNANINKPPTKTARWPKRRAMCCWMKKAYKHAEKIKVTAVNTGDI